MTSHFCAAELLDVVDLVALACEATGDSQPLKALARKWPTLLRTPTPPPIEYFSDIAPDAPWGSHLLLDRARNAGVDILHRLARAAIQRILGSGTAFPLRFFSDEEMGELSKHLAATSATGELLGRARIRENAERVAKFGEKNCARTIPNSARTVRSASQRQPARKQHQDSNGLAPSQRPASAQPAPHFRIVPTDLTAFRAKSLDRQEAGLWATHRDYKEIPEGEIWVDDEADPVDVKYFLINARHVEEGIAKGLTPDDAIDYGLAAERAERERNTHGGEGHDIPSHEQIPHEVYVKLWKQLNIRGERVDVYLVNGRHVREAFKTDWFSGGHAFVYPFVPENEIWIEAKQRKVERLCCLRHEAAERTKMRHEQLGYDDAHRHASRVEFAYRKQLMASRHSEPFEAFREATPSILAPQEALDYFLGLVPKLNVDPQLFGQAHERDAFTLARATNEDLLKKVQKLLAHAIATGSEIEETPRQINALLKDAGVHPSNPQYAEQVFRTNFMDAMNTGTMREIQAPDMVEAFPVWQFSGIGDGREGDDHKPWDGKYFENKVSFNEVRDYWTLKKGNLVHVPGKGRPYNCRHTPVPVHRSQWAELQKGGAKVHPWPPAAAFAEWEESQHPRDKAGEFSKGGSGKPTLLKTAMSKLTRRYTNLEQRYGRKGAITIVAAMAILLPTPIPGATLAPVAIAELLHRLKGRTATAHAEAVEIGPEQVRQFMAEVFEELGEKMPDLSDDSVSQAIAKASKSR